MSAPSTDGLSLSAEPFSMAGAIEPTRLSPAYRAGLVVVTAAMLLLPLVYVAIIVLTGMGVWWHLTSNQGLLDGRGSARFIAYLTPAVVGVIVMFFMVKPLLARPAGGREPIPVDPEREPLLFSFVRQICQQVRAPLPRRVQVDCQVNASAGFLRGVLSRDLVLTIGLPLAAGLSVRELGGVLAHEFGHFAQGGGMRLTAIVRGINAWFARVVYERDQWDERLAAWSKDADWRLMIVLGLARGAVWISRRVLTGLMWAGHAISCFMMRQMEYDADSYEIKFAGTDAFARTSARLRELGAASSVAYHDLGDALREQTLPSNLPAYVAGRLERMPEGLASRVRAVPDRKTGVFDTHPSDADRLRAAEAAAAPGVLIGGDGPAAELFSQFEALCAEATRHHYQHDLGVDASAVTLVSTDLAASESSKREAGRRAIHAVFGGCFSLLRPIRSPLADGLDSAALVAGMEEARGRMQALAGEPLAAQYRQTESLERRRVDAFTVEKLFEAGFTKIDASSFGLATGTRDEAAAAHAAAVQEQRAIAPSLDAFERAASRRLSNGVALWGRTRRRDGMPEPDDVSDRVADPGAELTALNVLAGVVPAAAELRGVVQAAAVVEGNQASSPNAALAARTVSHLEQRMTSLLRRMYDPLHLVALPPGVASKPAATLAEYCGLSASTPPGHALDVVDRVGSLYLTLLGRVASTAIEVEGDMLRPEA